jgi:hypothetical protein
LKDRPQTDPKHWHDEPGFGFCFWRGLAGDGVPVDDSGDGEVKEGAHDGEDDDLQQRVDGFGFPGFGGFEILAMGLEAGAAQLGGGWFYLVAFLVFLVAFLAAAVLERLRTSAGGR